MRDETRTLNPCRLLLLACLPALLTLPAPCQGTGQVNVVNLVDFSLPDAPSVAQAGQDATGTLTGVVRDANGGLVQGATVVATAVDGSREFRATADSGGGFQMQSVPAGFYKVTVQADGLTTLVIPQVQVSAGQQQVLAEIALAAGAVSSDVSVVATPDEIAVAQVHAQEKQRALGFVPNFYTSYIYNAAPMPPSQKFGLATHSAFDPVAFISITAVAGVEQWRNTFAGYGNDAGAFGKRYAAAFGDEVIGRFLGSAIYPTIFHQDPRYFYKGIGSGKSRALYAMSRTVVARGDNGKQQFNYSRILGRLTAGAIANAYHPHADRGIGLTAANTAIALGANAFDNLFREFLLKRITPNVPAFANGLNSPKP